MWECELTPKKHEETLESIAFTLNHIWLQDHQGKVVSYPKLDEEDMRIPMAAEEEGGSIALKCAEQDEEWGSIVLKCAEQDEEM